MASSWTIESEANNLTVPRNRTSRFLVIPVCMSLKYTSVPLPPQKPLQTQTPKYDTLNSIPRYTFKNLHSYCVQPKTIGVAANIVFALVASSLQRQRVWMRSERRIWLLNSAFASPFLMNSSIPPMRCDEYYSKAICQFCNVLTAA